MNFSHNLNGPANQLQLGNDSSSLDLRITWNYISLITNVINITLGSPINCFVLWLICKKKGNGIVPEFFNFNLTVCELLWCLCSSIFIAALWFKELLYVMLSVSAIVGVCRPLFHCLICFERYLAVLHPVSFLKFKPLRYRLACSALVWVTVPPFSMLCMLLVNTPNIRFFVGVFMSINLLLLSFKLFCLLAVLKALKFPKAAQRMNITRNEEARQKLRKAMSQILITTVSMLGHYVPALVVGGLLVNFSDKYFLIFWCAGHVINSITNFVHPVLHIWGVKKRPKLPDSL